MTYPSSPSRESNTGAPSSRSAAPASVEALRLERVRKATKDRLTIEEVFPKGVPADKRPYRERLTVDEYGIEQILKLEREGKLDGSTYELPIEALRYRRYKMLGVINSEVLEAILKNKDKISWRYYVRFGKVYVRKVGGTPWHGYIFHIVGAGEA